MDYNQPETEHEIDAYYSNLPGPAQTMVLSCSCGEYASGWTWEEAGVKMDVHLFRLLAEDAV